MQPLTGQNGVLNWPGRVLSALDLERLRHDVTELVLAPGTVVTPSAREWLRDRGVRLTNHAVGAALAPANAGNWRVAQDRPFTVIQGVLAALGRDGVNFEPWPEQGSASPAEWVRWLAEEIDHGTCRGAVVLCGDATLACCVANRLTNIRAAAVTTVPQAERALKSLGANWLAVEMPGRSFFELRQMLRLAAAARAECPAGLAETLAEMKSGGCACASRK